MRENEEGRSQNLEINPTNRRARTITTVEGKFINVSDIAKALNDDAFVMMCAGVLKVGYELGDSSTEVLRRTIGCAIMVLAGDEGWATAKAEKGGAK